MMPMGKTPPEAKDIGHLNNDWLKTQQLHNNATSTWTYDALARVTDLVTRSGPGAMDPLRSSFTGLTYDGASNRLSLTASIPHHPAFDGTTTYQYDTKDQLTQETSTRAGGYTNNFVYDPAGNPTTFKGVTATFNSNNQRTSDVHDGNGNPTTYKGVTCTFDPLNSMTSYGTVLTAGYRGDGLRAWKQTVAGRTYFLYSGTVLLAEMNSIGVVTSVNTFGAAGLVSRTVGSATTFYTFDAQGSVAQRLDGTGTVVTSHLFDVYGTGTGTGASDCYGFGAQLAYYTDAETGIQLLSFRYYDSSRGRFLTRDPIGDLGGVNLYNYCANDPIGYRDPLGLRPAPKRRPIDITNPVPGGNPGWGPVNSKRPHVPTYPGHEGLDIFAKKGTPVNSATWGLVMNVRSGGKGGNRLWIVDDAGLWWYYAHLNKAPLVNEGDFVCPGQQIGEVGNTGAPGSPPHLHIGIATGRTGTGGMNWDNWYYPYDLLGDVPGVRPRKPKKK